MLKWQLCSARGSYLYEWSFGPEQFSDLSSRNAHQPRITYPTISLKFNAAMTSTSPHHLITSTFLWPKYEFGRFLFWKPLQSVDHLVNLNSDHRYVPQSYLKNFVNLTPTEEKAKIIFLNCIWWAVAIILPACDVFSLSFLPFVFFF